MRKNKLIVCAVTFTSAISGYASDVLTFQQFRESCINPAQFNRQIPPSNIRIKCSTLEKTWEALPAGANSVPTKRYISSTLQSSKFSVAQTVIEIENPKFIYSCPQLKEVERTLTSERSVSCDEIIGFKGTLEEYCLDFMNEEIALNPKVINVRETGATMSTCSSTTTAIAPTQAPQQIPVAQRPAQQRPRN